QVREAGKADRVFSIVGLVRDAKYTDLREEFTPIVFVPEAQDEEPRPEVTFLVRSDRPEAEVVAGVKRVLAEASPSSSVRFRALSSTGSRRAIRARSGPRCSRLPRSPRRRASSRPDAPRRSTPCGRSGRSESERSGRADGPLSRHSFSFRAVVPSAPPEHGKSP